MTTNATATSCARTPEHADRERENQLVNIFAAACQSACAETPLSTPGVPVTPDALLERIHNRAGALNKAIVRVSAAASRMRVA